ncbi:glycerophosphodiester phosphodiesterase [Enterococcus alishanensis]
MHAGNSQEYPENSLPGFRTMPDNFKAVECDIINTKDNQWVLMHDLTIDRTTNGSGYVQDMTLEELRQYRLDIGPNINNMTDSEKMIPTLKELLLICKEKGVTPLIELRQRDYTDDAYLELFKQINEVFNMSECVLMGFYLKNLEKLRAMSASIQLWYLAYSLNDDVLATCTKNSFNVNVIESANDLTKDRVTTFKQSGVEVGAWTLYNRNRYQYLLDCNVDHITTNLNDLNI